MDECTNTLHVKEEDRTNLLPLVPCFVDESLHILLNSQRPVSSHLHLSLTRHYEEKYVAPHDGRTELEVMKMEMMEVNVTEVKLTGVELVVLVSVNMKVEEGKLTHGGVHWISRVIAGTLAEELNRRESPKIKSIPD